MWKQNFSLTCHTLIFTNLVFLLLSPSALTQQKVDTRLTDELKHPQWQEVPDTEIGVMSRPGTKGEDFNENTMIDINGLVRQNEAVIFDVIGSDAAYSRLAANCKTYQVKSLRSGDFESKSRVRFESFDYPWIEATPYQRKIIQFACLQTQPH